MILKRRPQDQVDSGQLLKTKVARRLIVQSLEQCFDSIVFFCVFFCKGFRYCLPENTFVR